MALEAEYCRAQMGNAERDIAAHGKIRKKWRAEMRGTAAENVVLVAGV